MMTGGVLVLDAPVGPNPGEGMRNGTIVLLRPNHIPRRLPPRPARVIVPRGTSKDVKDLGELEMDHQEVEELALVLKDLGVSTPEKVADLLVVLVPEAEGTLPRAEPAPARRAVKTGVVLEVPEVPKAPGKPKKPKGKGGGGETDPDASSRFADFSKDINDEGGRK
jgi:hypothetical protein